MHSTIIKQDQT